VFRRTLTVALSAMALIVVLAVPAFAGHDHFVETPNGNCHQVAQGQTSIDDASHGGYHRFHSNVHLGATDESNRDLGKGHSPVNVYKNACP
jgi:hypothetical protein